MGLSPTKTTVTTLEDRSWMGPSSDLDRRSNRSRTLDGDSVRGKFAAGTFCDGGTVLAIATTGSEKAVLYAGTSDEVQTVTVTGAPTGGTFTLTFSGQTTAAIAFNATAAQVQAALVALSNIGANDVTVTGADGGPYTVTFGGDLADTNVAQLTSTPSLTGGSSPSVTHATGTGGGTDLGSNGSGTAVGFLDSGFTVPTTGDIHIAIFSKGQIVEANLPATSGLDAAAKADLAHFFQFI